MKFRNVISGPIFCADAPDVVIETADAAGIDVRLSISGFVWQFALSPVAEQSGYVATIKTRDILEALIEPSSIGSGGVSGVPVVEISAGADTESSISMSFQALYGSAAGKTPADMARHWLTWRDQISATYFGCREHLTFFAGLDLLGWKSGSYTVAVKIYTPSGIVQATLASGTIPSQVSYISVDASPASVLAVGEVSSLLAYDLSFSLSGTAADDTAATVESYPLRLVLGAADPRAKEFIYINSLGVEDRVTACGIRKDGLEGGSSKFVNGGVEREHGNEAQEQFEVYSGHLATARSVEQWMEFLKSSERYLSSGGLKGIVIDDYNTEVQEGELCSVSFTYRLSERIKGFHHDDSESIGEYDPTQKYGALVVGDVPDAANPPAEDLFFLKTRLDEFPLVSLSEDYLLLVQSPVSYHWGAVSLDSVKNWIQKTIDHNGISLAAVWASLAKTVPDTYANELISEDHIPTLPQSKVDGLAESLAALKALIGGKADSSQLADYVLKSTYDTGMSGKLDKSVFDKLFTVHYKEGSETEIESLELNYGTWTTGFLSVRGLDDTTGSGSGGTDLPVVWASLQGNTDDYKDKTIHQAHIPTLPVSRIDGLATALAGKQAAISDLDTIRTNAATAFGWGDHSKAGYITGITKAMVESVLTGNITSHTHTFVSLTSKPTTLAGYGITDANRIFRYTIPASGNKGVRITFSANEPVKITVSGSNQHAQLVLVGTGYGEGGFSRNNFTELVHSDSGYSWCMPDEARSVEVFSTRTVADYVTVESPSPVTFTAISALSKTAVNRRLLNSLNYSSYALPLTGGTLNGWLLINASTLSIAELTADTSTLDTSWNRAQNINLLLRSENNAMTISLGGQSNERKGIIQVGHAATTYANVLGDLYLNKFGGKVYIGEKLAYHEGNANDLSTVWSAKRLVTPDNLICPYTWYNNNNITGTIVLSLPYSFNSMMQCIELTLYDYTTVSGFRGATKFIINGYNYYSATNSSWVNPMVFRIGNTNVNVRVGHYKNTCCILIGTTDHTWLYPRLCVDKLYGSFSNHADSFKNNDWSCTILQDESEITNIVNATDTPLYAPCYTRAGLPYVTDNDVAAKYLKLSGGTMAGDAAISWGVNDRTDWDTYVSGIRVMSSITANSGAPVQYATGISVMARYSFQIAAQGGDVDAFFIRAGNRDWKKLLHEGNYSSYALPLTGGTIKGSIRMDGTTTKVPIVRNFKYIDSTSQISWARHIAEIHVDDKKNFAIGGYGNKYIKDASDNKMTYAYLGFANYDGLNLRIFETDIKWGNNAIYHAGNSNLPTVPWNCSSLVANGSVEAKANLYGQSLEFLNISSSANHGGFIDFHFKGSTEDYTSRIIEDAKGQLTLYAARMRIGKSNSANLLLLRPSYNYIWADVAGGTLVLGTADGGGTSSSNSALFIKGKKVYIGGTESGNNALNVLGVAHATTGIYTDGYISARKQDTSSDIRLKTDFRPLDGALEYIRGTHFTRFRWKDGSGESVGIIAQEEQSREYGFLVRSHGEIGHLTYDYAASTALLGAALQEEDDKVEALKRRVKELENKLNKLKQSNYAR